MTTNKTEAQSTLPSGELLGSVTVPSGTLKLFDCGNYARLLDGSIPELPGVQISNLPKDKSLEIRGIRVTGGDSKGNWESVSILVNSQAQVTQSEPAGDLLVDWARIMIADLSSLKSWNHDQPVDGKADFLFWGRDASSLAKAMETPELEEGMYGWVDRKTEDCIDLGTKAETLKAENGWLLATDYRPHSHHFLILEQMRASPTQSGTLSVGGAQLCVFFTTWGDGIFEVFRDLDANGKLVQVRIQLASQARREWLSDSIAK